MKKPFSLCFFSLLVLCSSFLIAGEDIVLLDPGKTGKEGLHEQWSQIELKNNRLLMKTDPSPYWPGFNMGKRQWDLSSCDRIQIDVTNSGTEPLRILCRIDSPDSDNGTMRGTYTRDDTVAPGETKQCEILLPALTPPQLQPKLFGMRGAPGGGDIAGVDENTVASFRKSEIVGLIIFLDKPSFATQWSVGKIVAKAENKRQQPAWKNFPAEKFFPFIDVYGQFKYEDWPGKIHSDKELKASIAQEQRELQKFPGPKNRSTYGGYTAAPKREATGHFRVEKIDGAWWLVDPEGHLFWSHGVDCVRFGHSDTPITGREFYFTELPKRDDPVFQVCYGESTWATNNPYYQRNNPFVIYNFARANLIRKYGPDWKKETNENTHRRLKSWGLNTIGNWSDLEIRDLKRTPYTTWFNSDGPRIEGSSGYWGKFPDPFSKEFEGHVNWRANDEAKRSGKDPWCIGYFVDNELSWGDERSLAIGALTSPATQPAKIACIDFLKEKYGEIGNLNKNWGTDHSDWIALLQSTAKPDESKAGPDLDQFHRKACEKYFQVIRDAIKREAPDKLYLGCRFAWAHETAIRVSAEYCDIVSFNKYVNNLNDFKLPQGIDKPVMIGEFHFGALDRGMFHTGLVSKPNQQARAKAYDAYVRSALHHPALVGTHWFQYSDQATTGREDGENFQIGLINICDVPYPETIQAVRKIGNDIYQIRLNQKRSK